MNRPFISIIINCLNGEEYLRDAIDSIYSQTYTNWEIIFWDNASTDKSAEIAKSYGKKLRYFLSGSVDTLYKARNKSILEAHGEYLAFLDCDDVWTSKKLEKIVFLMSLKPDGAAYASNFRYLYNNKPGKSFYSECDDSLLEPSFSHLISNYNIAISSVVLSKDLFDRNSGFDSNFECTGDKELLVRLALKNNIYITREVLTLIRIHDHNLTNLSFEKFPNENYMLLKKLMQQNSWIFDNNEELLLEAIKKPLFQKSIMLWRSGNNSDSRKLILSLLPSIKHLMFLIVTLLPSRLYLKISNLYKTLK
jgi:glycosyltransferase involved in cell wall biosynthesis